MPVEKLFVAWGNTEEIGLFKIPLFESRIDETSPPVRKMSQVLVPFKAEKEIRWIPAHMKKASDFTTLISTFPPMFDEAEQLKLTRQMPVVQSIPMKAIFFKSTPVYHQPRTVDIIEAQKQVKKTRLTQAQQSQLIQFIQLNEHWPLKKGMGRLAQIALCETLIQGTAQHDEESLPFKKYRNPIFLAQLMTGAFYPQNAFEEGWNTTVGDVWCFVNLLLNNAAWALGNHKKIEYSRPPRGTGVRASLYLDRMGNHQASTNSLTTNEEDAYQFVLDNVEDIYQLADPESLIYRATIDQYNSTQLKQIVAILKELIHRRASVTHLSDKLFYALKGLLSASEIDDEEIIQILIASCTTMHGLFSVECLKRGVQALNSHIPSADCHAFIVQLAEDIRAFHCAVDSLDVLNDLSTEQRGMLIDYLKNEAKLLFNITSSAAVREMLMTTPSIQHKTLINLFVREIQQLHAENRLECSTIQPLLDRNAQTLLMHSIQTPWQRSKMTGVLTPSKFISARPLVSGHKAERPEVADSDRAQYSIF